MTSAVRSAAEPLTLTGSELERCRSYVEQTCKGVLRATQGPVRAQLASALGARRRRAQERHTKQIAEVRADPGFPPA